MSIVGMHMLLVTDGIAAVRGGHLAQLCSIAPLFHGLFGAYLIATIRRIGMATSTTSRFFSPSSRYSIARSTRDQRVFGR